MSSDERMEVFLDALDDDDDVDDLYERAPCGYLSTSPDGLIVKINQTLLDWIGYRAEDLVGRRRFADLLTGGGRIYHETHFAPMLRMNGRVKEIALDIVCSDGTRIPALVNSVMERDEAGEGRVIRSAIFDATERRMYERELVAARQRAEASEARAKVLINTLQQTLIPPALPQIPMLDIAAVYRPAGDGAEIGGDFFDVFQIGPDDWVVAIGDVQGKGSAAAVVTALVRHTIRAASVEHDLPSAVLGILNRALLRDHTERLCTAVVMRLRRTERWRVTLACAGHPFPLLRRVGGEAHGIGRQGSLLGFFEAGTFHDQTIALDTGDVIVVYTDGVSEARRGSEWFGEDRIAAALHADWGAAEDLTERILEEVLVFQEGDARDDIALVAIVVPTERWQARTTSPSCPPDVTTERRAPPG